MAIDTVSGARPQAPLLPQGSTGLLAALAPGDKVDATVLARLETGEIRLALLGTLLDILPSEPLTPGEAVKLTVVETAQQLAVSVQRQTPDAAPAGADLGAEAPAAVATLRPAPSTSPASAPAGDGPSPEARAALGAVLPRAAANQQGRAPLIANAVAILAGPAGDQLPAAVRNTLAALLATALDPTSLDGPALQGAVARSGSFQEAAILRLAQAPAGADAAAALQGDAKSLMLALRPMLQALADGRSVPPADPPPLPRRGAVPQAQPAVAATLGPDASTAQAARTLLAGVEGALDRTRLLQAASLPEARPGADDPSAGERLVEIPLALPGGQTPVMALAVGGDGRAAGTAGAAPAWRMRLSLDLGDTGPMHALVSVRGETAGVTLWAEQPGTVELFRRTIGDLREALEAADLDVGSLDIRAGAPPAPPPAATGTFLDRRS